MSLLVIPVLPKTNVLACIIHSRQLHTPKLLRTDGMTAPFSNKKKKKKVPLIPRIQDVKYAGKIASVLKKHIRSSDAVIECFPGKGILTQELHNRNIKKICCFEPEESYISDIQALQKGNKSLELDPRNFFTARGQPKDGLFQKLSDQPWKKDPLVKVIGFLHPDNTSLWMSRNIHYMANGTFPYSKGRADFFLFVSGREHQLMFASDAAAGAMNGPTPRRIFDYELFYDTSSLLKVPADIFDIKINFGHVPKTAHWDQNHFYLVRMTPKKDLFTTVCMQTDIPDFITFVQQLLRVRKSRLIPRLEQWCPSLGLVAIDLEYSMMDTVKQIRAKDLPILFKELKAKGGLEALKADLIADQETVSSVPTNQDSVPSDTRPITEVVDALPDIIETKARDTKLRKALVNEAQDKSLDMLEVNHESVEVIADTELPVKADTEIPVIAEVIADTKPPVKPKYAKKQDKAFELDSGHHNKVNPVPTDGPFAEMKVRSSDQDKQENADHDVTEKESKSGKLTLNEIGDVNLVVGGSDQEKQVNAHVIEKVSKSEELTESAGHDQEKPVNSHQEVIAKESTESVVRDDNFAGVSEQEKQVNAHHEVIEDSKSEDLIADHHCSSSTKDSDDEKRLDDSTKNSGMMKSHQGVSLDNKDTVIADELTTSNDSRAVEAGTSSDHLKTYKDFQKEMNVEKTAETTVSNSINSEAVAHEKPFDYGPSNDESKKKTVHQEQTKKGSLWKRLLWWK